RRQPSVGDHHGRTLSLSLSLGLGAGDVEVAGGAVVPAPVAAPAPSRIYDSLNGGTSGTTTSNPYPAMNAVAPRSRFGPNSTTGTSGATRFMDRTQTRPPTN
ncbi:unnamed protein product, partial [Amoebophrya sp. A25]